MRAGASLVLLTDRYPEPGQAVVPALLATGAVHHHLVATGQRCRANVVVETGAARGAHAIACLVGVGATAVYPYLAYQTIAALGRSGVVAGKIGKILRTLERGIAKDRGINPAAAKEALAAIGHTRKNVTTLLKRVVKDKKPASMDAGEWEVLGHKAVMDELDTFATGPMKKLQEDIFGADMPHPQAKAAAKAITYNRLVRKRISDTLAGTEDFDEALAKVEPIIRAELERLAGLAEEASKRVDTPAIMRAVLEMRMGLKSEASAAVAFKAGADKEMVARARVQSATDQLMNFYDYAVGKLMVTTPKGKLVKLKTFLGRKQRSLDASEQRLLRLGTDMRQRLAAIARQNPEKASEIVLNMIRQESISEPSLGSRLSWMPTAKEIWKAERILEGTAEQKNAFLEKVLGIKHGYVRDPIMVMQAAGNRTGDIVRRHAVVTNMLLDLERMGGAYRGIKDEAGVAQPRNKLDWHAHQALDKAGFEHGAMAPLYNATNDLFIAKESMDDVRRSLSYMARAEDMTGLPRLFMRWRSLLTKYGLGLFPQFLSTQLYGNLGMTVIHMGINPINNPAFHAAAGMLGDQTIFGKAVTRMSFDVPWADKIRSEWLADATEMMMPMNAAPASYMATGVGDIGAHHTIGKMATRQTETMGEVLDVPFANLERKGLAGKVAAKTARTIDKGVMGMFANATYIDNYFRLGSYLAKRMEGMSHVESMKFVNKYLFPMDALSALDKKIMPFVPFYSWTTRAVPFGLHTFFERPDLYGRIAHWGESVGMEPAETDPTASRSSFGKAVVNIPGNQSRLSVSATAMPEFDTMRMLDTWLGANNPIEAAIRLGSEQLVPPFSTALGYAKDALSGKERSMADTMGSLPFHAERLLGARAPAGPAVC